METNKRQHFISLFFLPLLFSCSGEKKAPEQTEAVSNKTGLRSMNLQRLSKPTFRTTSPRKPRCA